MNDHACVILFAKAPIRGRVKTRLAKDLDDTQAVSLYRNFVRDIVDKIAAAGFCLKIFHDSPGSLPLMKEWLGNGHEYILQEGSHLGQKMANAFAWIFERGVHQAVLMGADLPDLPAMILTDALSVLDSCDAVLGPALDGGYYLIGFNSNSFRPEIFEEMPWSTSRVFETTMARFSAAGIRVQVLPEWRDIDTYDDLAMLVRSLIHHPDRAPRTTEFLKCIGLIPYQ